MFSFRMMDKIPSRHPSAVQILQEPYIKRHMEVKDDGKHVILDQYWYHIMTSIDSTYQALFDAR